MAYSCCNSMLWKHGVNSITASNILAAILHLRSKKPNPTPKPKKKGGGGNCCLEIAFPGLMPIMCIRSLVTEVAPRIIALLGVQVLFWY